MVTFIQSRVWAKGQKESMKSMFKNTWMLDNEVCIHFLPLLSQWEFFSDEKKYFENTDNGSLEKGLCTSLVEMFMLT